MLAVKLILCHPGPCQNRRTGLACKPMNTTPFTHPNRSSDRSKTGFQGVSGLQPVLRSCGASQGTRFSIVAEATGKSVEARAGIEPAIEVLQTSALPLGYRAAEKEGKNR
jgi:hypothetical protein